MDSRGYRSFHSFFCTLLVRDIKSVVLLELLIPGVDPEFVAPLRPSIKQCSSPPKKRGENINVSYPREETKHDARGGPTPPPKIPLAFDDVARKN